MFDRLLWTKSFFNECFGDEEFYLIIILMQSAEMIIISAFFLFSWNVWIIYACNWEQA